MYILNNIHEYSLNIQIPLDKYQIQSIIKKDFTDSIHPLSERKINYHG